jgi:osmotically-inducible protein OsmY
MRMCTRACVVIAAGLMVVVASWSSSAQDPSTIDKIKAKAGDAVNSVKKGAANAGEAIKDKFAKTKDSVLAMEIEHRVYARLHWDKALVGSKIELAAPKLGVIALNGTVTDEKAKNKAFELTQDTVGVVEVQNHLVIGTATTTTTTTTKKLGKP